MQLKDVTPIIKAILEERDKIPVLHNTERYIPHWTPWHAGNFMRGGIRKALRIIEQAPVVDAVPVVHARWETYTYSNRVDTFGNPDTCAECSNCSFHWNGESDAKAFFGYCPNCGAKMDGGNSDDA